MATRAAQRKPHLFARGGLALVAPMLSLERAVERGFNRFLLPLSGVASAVAPTLGVAKGTPRNPVAPQLNQQAARDPLCVDHGAPTVARVAREYYQATKAAQADMGILRAEHVPLLTMHSPDDQATDPRGSELLRERAGARFVTCVGMYHNLLSEPGRARVHAEVVRFFSARAAR